MREHLIRLALLTSVVVLFPNARAEDRSTERSTLPLAATLYYTALQQDYPDGSDAEFLDQAGDLVRRGSEIFLAAASIEGTAEFYDGTVLNYHVKVGDEVRWLEVDEGLDARGCALIPFRSAAVDPRLVPLGTLLVIDETIGMPLPGGGRHDGVWIATDTGTGILGQRIDLYTGRGMDSMNVVYDFNIGHLEKLNVRLKQGNLPCLAETWPYSTGPIEYGHPTAY